MLLVVLVFILGVGLVLGGYAAVTRLPDILAQRQLDRRLQEVSLPKDAPAIDESVVARTSEGPLPAVVADPGRIVRLGVPHQHQCPAHPTTLSHGVGSCEPGQRTCRARSADLSAVGPTLALLAHPRAEGRRPACDSCTPPTGNSA